MKEFTILFFIFPFSDGSGDFSFVYKTVDTFVKRGISPRHIHIVVSTIINTSGFQAFNDMIKAIDACKDQVQPYDTTVTERNLFTQNQGHSYIINRPDIKYIATSTSDDTKIMITDDLYTNLQHTITSICKKYNAVLQCDSVVSNEPSDATRQHPIQVDDIRNHFIDLLFEQHNNVDRIKIKELLLLQENGATEDEITEYIKSHVTYKCAIDTNVLLLFLKLTLRTDFIIWLTNIIAFFIPLQEKGISLKISSNKELNTIKKSDFIITTSSVLLLSFLFTKSATKSFHESLSIYPHIQLNEGGFCSISNNYSTGFGNKKCLGINVLDKTLIVPRPSYQPLHDGNYHVCYFGAIPVSTTMDPTYILTLFKLKYLLDKVIELKTNAIVYVNKTCYDRIRLCAGNDYITTIYGTIDLRDDFILLQGVTVYYYHSLSNKDFINFLYYSQPLCILRGDQSYFEGICMGKIILYDMLSFKMPLYQQMLLLYRTFSDNESRILPAEIKQAITDITIQDNYLYFQNELLQQRIVTTEYTITTEGFDYNASIIKESYNASDPFSWYPYPPISFRYKTLQKLYDITYDLCSFLTVPAVKDNFITWLYEHHDFDKKLVDLIMHIGESGLKIGDHVRAEAEIVPVFKPPAFGAKLVGWGPAVSIESDEPLQNSPAFGATLNGWGPSSLESDEPFKNSPAFGATLVGWGPTVSLESDRPARNEPNAPRTKHITGHIVSCTNDKWGIRVKNGEIVEASFDKIQLYTPPHESPIPPAAMSAIFGSFRGGFHTATMPKNSSRFGKRFKRRSKKYNNKKKYKK